jgi:hypothetical protein
VIDTSNLVDHLGSLNVLVAASPLLSKDPSATLYTEFLNNRYGNFTSWIENEFCGHIPTIANLLGLFLVEFWNAATSTLKAEDALRREFMAALDAEQGKKDGGIEHMHTKMTWKRTSSLVVSAPCDKVIKFDESELACLLFQTYLSMFANEDPVKTLANNNLATYERNSLPQYTRGSFAAFLHLIQGRVAVDWNKMMENFWMLAMGADSSLNESEFFQELHVQMHLLFGESLLPDPRMIDISKKKRSLGVASWKHQPTVVCLTFVVPRSCLEVFTVTDQDDTKPRLPFVMATVKSSKYPHQHAFAITQLAFGKLSTSGARNSTDLQVHVAEDKRGWSGDSPLIIAFYVPTYLLLVEPEAQVNFEIMSTPHTVKRYGKLGGGNLRVHSVKLLDEDSVYISKARPHQTSIVPLDLQKANNTKEPTTLGTPEMPDASLAFLEHLVSTSHAA